MRPVYFEKIWPVLFQKGVLLVQLRGVICLKEIWQVLFPTHVTFCIKGSYKKQLTGFIPCKHVLFVNVNTLKETGLTGVTFCSGRNLTAGSNTFEKFDKFDGVFLYLISTDNEIAQCL